MADMQEFPDNWEDFIKMHEFDDSAEVYTNGALLVPSFRVEQMVEHYFERTCKADYRSGGYGIGGWYCSECGGYMHDDMQQDMAYCPLCGAKVVSE